MVWFLGTLSFTETSQAVGLLCSAVVIAAVPSQRLEREGAYHPLHSTGQRVPAPLPHPHSWLALGLVLGWVASSKICGLYWAAAALGPPRMAVWPLAAHSRAATVALVRVEPVLLPAVRAS